MIDLLLAAALLQAGAAPDRCHAGPPTVAIPGCPSWRQVRHTEAGDGYVDQATIRRSGDTVEVTILSVVSVPLPNGTSRIMTRMRVDCPARTALRLHLTLFDATGRQLFDSPVNGAQATGDNGYRFLIDEVCGGRPT